MTSATWARDHPWTVDVMVTGFASIASLASVFYISELVGWNVALVFHVLPPVAIAVRRRRPRVVTGALLALDVATWLLSVPYSGAQLATLIALYTVARNARSLGFLVATIVLVLVAPIRQPFTDATSVVAALACVVLVYLLGRTVELRAQYLQGLEDHALRLERERDADIEAAAEHERVRIAREMHDVVAHHVSVMVVQAEGAGWAIEDDPAAARIAVADIADTGRSALAELRLLLGVLREGSEHDARPQPQLSDLEDLVDRFVASGLIVRWHPADLPSSVPGSSVPGSSVPGSSVPGSVELAVFRIVQEALTNVLKHAGQGTVVELDVSTVDSAVTVTVIDDGSGRGPQQLGPKAAGHGLTGISERVAMFDGCVTTGPRRDGGFEVRAVIPCR